METNEHEPVEVSDGVESVEVTEGDKPVELSLEDESVEVTEEDEPVELSLEDDPVQVTEGDVGQGTHHTASILSSSSLPPLITIDFRKVLSILKRIHTDEDGYDVQLQIGSKLFKTERSWLTVHSKYFHRMFVGDSPESKCTRDQPIILEGIDVTTFEEFYHFLYTYDVRVNDSNLIQMLDLYDKLSLSDRRFKQQCIEYMKRRSEEPEPISNAPDILEFASQKKENSLVHFLQAHISQHLYHYSKEASLKGLSFEYLRSLLKFSKNYISPLRVSGNVLVMIIHDWITHNPYRRSLERYTQLMQDIDGANISPDYSRLLADRQDEPYKLKTLETGMAMMSLTGNGAQLSANISFNIRNVNELQMGEIVSSSSSTTISNLKWKIGVRRNSNSLSMYLHCGGMDLSLEWSCYVSAKFTIMCNKEGGEDFVTGFNFGKFSSSEDDGLLIWFANNVLEWNDLINPENGYIKDDGSIWLNAHVQADVPFRKVM